MRLGAVLTPATRHAFTVRRAPPRGAQPDDPSMVKWRGRSVEVRAGEAFEFPFEVPAGGCVVRYAYQVHDSLEIPFSLTQGGTRLHADNGGSCEGEVRVPGGGLCTVLFDNSSLFSFASRVVSYEVVLVPSEHLALQQRRRALHLAATGALAPLLAALGDGVGVIDAADEQGRTALHAAAAGGHADRRGAARPRRLRRRAIGARRDAAPRRAPPAPPPPRGCCSTLAPTRRPSTRTVAAPSICSPARAAIARATRRRRRRPAPP